MSFEEGLDRITLPLGQDDDINKKIVAELFTSKGINLKTHLSDSEIKLLTRLALIGIIFNLDNMPKLTDTFKELRVSKERLGRLELIKALNYHEDDKGRRVDDLKRLLGFSR